MVWCVSCAERWRSASGRPRRAWRCCVVSCRASSRVAWAVAVDGRRRSATSASGSATGGRSAVGAGAAASLVSEGVKAGSAVDVGRAASARRRPISSTRARAKPLPRARRFPPRSHSPRSPRRRFWVGSVSSSSSSSSSYRTRLRRLRCCVVVRTNQTNERNGNHGSRGQARPDDLNAEGHLAARGHRDASRVLRVRALDVHVRGARVPRVSEAARRRKDGRSPRDDDEPVAVASRARECIRGGYRCIRTVGRRD